LLWSIRTVLCQNIKFKNKLYLGRIASLLSEDEIQFIQIYFKSDSKNRPNNNAV
jgi:hypothetical protein